MAQQIQPQELYLLQDNPFIRTKCPQDQITDAMIVRRVKNANLIAGDIVRVQCMNSDYTDLLSECEYRVTSRKTELKTHEINDRDIRQVEEITFKVERWTEWRAVGQGAVKDRKAVWNLSKRGYDIVSEGVVIGFHEDKATAKQIAAGEMPLPEAV